MRKFSSYGPIDTDLHYYVPRQTLIEQALAHVVGEDPNKGGHYITVWAPRQRGKTWIMQQVLHRLRTDPQYAAFDVLKLNLEHLKLERDINHVIQAIAEEIVEKLALHDVQVNRLQEFYHVFKQGVLKRPLILILDEFDALTPEAIGGMVGVFRNIYNNRRDQLEKNTAEKDYLLHGVALIGVRSVLGVENRSGSPFNVQRSLHIPNLTFAEVESMYRWYEQESGQSIEPVVIEQVYAELRGQPGLTSWFGELLTETYNKQGPTITARDFEIAYAAASNFLPNANILNIISKAKEEPYRAFVLEMFQTHEKIEFKYDDPIINFLYMNGVIDEEVIDETNYYVRFPCPFVQKRLFNHFAHELFRQVGQLHKPFDNLADTITETQLSLKNLLRRYQTYLQQNRSWLFKDAPRKANLRLYEAVYHFNLYMFLAKFLENKGGQVFPEFPTGNGQIDLLVRYASQVYGLELKSFTDLFGYQQALKQAARYAYQLHLSEITLVLFVEEIDEPNRTQYEAPYQDKQHGVTVHPVFVATGA
ncbi:MAG: AAA-like domain-containing protein [Caldilineaceae bacterium]